MCWTVSRLLRQFAGQGNEAGDGSSHTRTQDRSYYVDTLEVGRTFRRRISESTSSLSLEKNPGNSQGFISGGKPVGSCDARVRGRVSSKLLGALCAGVQHPVSGSILCPRTTQKSYRPRVSPIGSWWALSPTLLLAKLPETSRTEDVEPSHHETIQSEPSTGFVSLQAASSSRPASGDGTAPHAKDARRGR